MDLLRRKKRAAQALRAEDPGIPAQIIPFPGSTSNDDPERTMAQRQILQLVSEGKSSAEAAAMLFLSPKTVDAYRSRMMQKLEIGDLPGLVKFAIQHGITQLE